MEEWISRLVVILGLFVTVGAPIIKLNSNIVKLNVNMEAQRERSDKQEQELEKQKEEAMDAHKNLWLHNTEQDKRIEEHEFRITALEKEAV